MKLSIIDQIETPKLSLSNGANLFFTSQWNLPNRFEIKKGYVPLLRRFSNSFTMVSFKNDSVSPDYIGLINSKNVQTNHSFIFNISRDYLE